MKAQAFFPYFGGKHALSRHLPAPTHEMIVEPFAGSAGYATRWRNRRVWLNDADPLVAGVWEYLIRVPARELNRLPLVTNLDDLGPVPEAARNLIGFWLAPGRPTVRKRATGRRLAVRPHSTWGATVRERLCRQVEEIRHWKITCQDFSGLPDFCATWVIDPPYQGRSGRAYPTTFDRHEELGEWCRGRSGQIFVHEMQGATWLPFKPWREIPTQSRTRRCQEVLWESHQGTLRALPGWGPFEEFSPQHPFRPIDAEAHLPAQDLLENNPSGPARADMQGVPCLPDEF